MRYELLLFDADDTLFDFVQAERHAFGAMLAELRLDPPGPGAREELFRLYQRINKQVWSELEQGLLPKDQLNIERFLRLWATVPVQVDARASSECYVAHLSQCSFLLEEALETCVFLREQVGCRLGIITNGLQQVQRSRLERSALAPWVDFLVVSEECGHAKPDPRIFAYAFQRYPHAKPSASLFVGDRLETDVQGGNAFGLHTCWVNWERRPNETSIQPTYEVHSLRQLRALVDT
jgi:2-haloacid dehalogenase